MASIENRSRYVVTVLHREDLLRTFAYNRESDLKAHVAELRTQGFKPKLKRTNDSYAIRVREAGKRRQCLYASSEQEALNIKQRIELERRNGLFVDYAKSRSVTFADLLARYLREEAPRHKGFEVEGYTINAMLVDAGLSRVNLADALAAHANPHPVHAGKDFSRKTGKQVRVPAPSTCFIRKAFADVVPEDIHDYIDDRCETVGAATVDREIDLFSAVCNIAIDSWRIPVAKSPMDGVRRPKYFNERDRRLKGDEEARLLSAAYDEDAQSSIKARLEVLMAAERQKSKAQQTIYRRKAIVKAAREQFMDEAETSYTQVPYIETFIQFQLMTGARRSETMSLHWKDIDLVEQTAFIAETKNGRPRKLPLRQDLIHLLRQLPRIEGRLFPLSIDAVRKAWGRVCVAAMLVGDDELRIHDLRHEAISRVADAGGKVSGGFSLVYLQAFSGHRDTRMLLRYTHLCMPSFARRLDEAFAAEKQQVVHRGRRRLGKGSKVSMSQLIEFATAPAPQAGSRAQPPEESVQSGAGSLPSNVFAFGPRKVA